MVSGGFLWVSETFVARLHGLLLISYGRWVSYRFPAVSSGVPTRLIVLRVWVSHLFATGFLAVSYGPMGFLEVSDGFRRFPRVSHRFAAGFLAVSCGGLSHLLLCRTFSSVQSEA